MKAKALTATLLMSSALAVAALAACSATANTLLPGHYSLGGIQNICLVSNGTWYGETFANWGGHWQAGPTTEDSTLIYGNFSSGAGNDAMVVSLGAVKHADWTEWVDNTTGSFLDITVTRLAGKCAPPATRINGHNNPM